MCLVWQGNEPNYVACYANNVLYCASGKQPTDDEYLAASCVSRTALGHACARSRRGLLALRLTVKPYADAIKSADPSAKVSITYPTYGYSTNFPTYDSLNIWGSWVASGNAMYWDYATMHYYPQEKVVYASQTPLLNAVLYSTTDAPARAPDGIRALMSEARSSLFPMFPISQMSLISLILFCFP